METINIIEHIKESTEDIQLMIMFFAGFQFQIKNS